MSFLRRHLPSMPFSFVFPTSSIYSITFNDTTFSRVIGGYNIVSAIASIVSCFKGKLEFFFLIVLAPIMYYVLEYYCHCEAPSTLLEKIEILKKEVTQIRINFEENERKINFLMIERDFVRVFLDIDVGGQSKGRILIELFMNVTPITAENFRALCTGEKGIGINGKPLHFKGSFFHKAFAGLCEGGDFIFGDGTGGESIYGNTFKDENFVMTHTDGGILSMVNSGPHTNTSQFCICTKKLEQLDGTRVVFGKVVEGLEVVKMIESFGNEDGNIVERVVIVDCGQIKASRPDFA